MSKKEKNIYVLADIHGDLRRWYSILKQIDLQDELYILGDVIDRHPYGIDILLEIMNMPNAHMLLGNHEYMMLMSLKEDEHTDSNDFHYWREQWFYNGGQSTREAYYALPEADQKAVRAFLENLPVNLDIEVNGKKYKLVHSVPVEWFEDTGEYIDAKEYSVWHRRDASDPVPKDYTLIFGHTPTVEYQDDERMHIWYGENMIGIDCGSGYPDPPDPRYGVIGNLACLRLEDGKEFYSEEETTQY